jgi:hypothetical protein
VHDHSVLERARVLIRIGGEGNRRGVPALVGRMRSDGTGLVPGRGAGGGVDVARLQDVPCGVQHQPSRWGRCVSVAWENCCAIWEIAVMCDPPLIRMKIH